jgi:nitroreductase
MNLREAIHARRAVRAYKPATVDEATVRQLLQEAIQAPSAMNAQPWVFSIVQDRARLRRYSDRAKRQMLEVSATEPKVRVYANMLRNEAFNIFYDAGTLVVIGVRERTAFSEADGWLAAQNLMLAACEAGLGTCCIGFAVSVLNLPDVKQELAIPAEGAVIAPIIVGYPSSSAPPVARKEPYISSWLRG